MKIGDQYIIDPSKGKNFEGTISGYATFEDGETILHPIKDEKEKNETIKVKPEDT